MFQGSSIDSLGADGFQLWLSEFGRLQSLGVCDIAKDWLQVSNGLERERQVLRSNGVSWNELAILEPVRSPMASRRVEPRLSRSQLKVLLRHADVDAALQEIATDARSACDVELGG